MKQNQFISNRHGMSLVEVMVIVTVMSLMTLGMATMFKNVAEIESQTVIRSVLYEMQDRIEDAIRNDTAWARSVRDPANALITCLDRGLPNCSNGTFNGGLRLYDATGAIIYDRLAATGGFNFAGVACNTFNAGGNDNCPFRYDFSVQYICKSGATCQSPEVRVRGTLLFRPANPEDVKNRINVNDYQIDIERSSRSRYEAFELRYADGHVNSNTGGGRCRSAWVPRPLNQLVFDYGNNVLATGAAWASLPPDSGAIPNTTATSPGAFQIRPGSYECTIIAQGFEALDGFRLRLVDLDGVAANRVGPFSAGGAFSKIGFAVFSKATVNFSIVRNTWFRLEHFCQGQSVRPWLTVRERSYMMGIPLPTYGGGANATVYTTISCVRKS